MNIRKFSKRLYNADELEKLGTWTPQARRYVQVCVLAEKNLLVAGGTSSGKTTLLNVLGSLIPTAQRIVTIEDSAELALDQVHVVALESRQADRYGKGAIGIGQLFRSSLRLRPDRIIIGEVRGGEALQMIQAMTSGHAGSMSTLHADTPADALARLETLAMMGEVELPLYALRAQVASAIDLIVQMVRLHDGRRLITQLSEVAGLDEQGRYRLVDIFVSDVADAAAQLRWTGAVSRFAREPRIRQQSSTMGPAAPIFQVEGAAP
jgi:pilus assembly protein CpaF